MQARGMVLFFLAFVLLAGGLAGGKLLLLAASAATLALALGMLLKCKPWEQEGD